MKKAFDSTWRNTNICEGAFGHIKYILDQFTNIKVYNASAIACAVKDRLFVFNSSKFEAKSKKRKAEEIGMDDVTEGLMNEFEPTVLRAMVMCALGDGKKKYKAKGKLGAEKAHAAQIARGKAKMQVRAALLFMFITLSFYFNYF